MSAAHYVLLVEDRSSEAFLREALPRLLRGKATFGVYPFLGKNDLLKKLPKRLNGYASWLPVDWRIVVLLDRDDDDCQRLKQRLEIMAASAGLATRSVNRAAWRVANRIAVEELEAWFFGDLDAVRKAFPRVSRRISKKKEPYRNPDDISRTWEALEKLLKQAGYFPSGLQKISTARAIGRHLDPDANTSQSFQTFCATFR